MTKLGTPIGAGPKSAIVTSGLALVGVPSGRRGGSSCTGSRPCSAPPWSGPTPPVAVVSACSLEPRPLPPAVPIEPPAMPLPPVAPEWVVLLPPPVLPPPWVVLLPVVLLLLPVVVLGGVVVVVGGAPVPDSVASRGPVQSGSARSLSPSPSSSARFEHCGSA